MNPFLIFRNESTSLKINSIRTNVFGSLDVPLSSLPDVEISDPQQDQTLQYSSSLKKWVNSTLNKILSGLNDVLLTTPSMGDFLVYNGTKWVNQAKSFITTLAGLSDVLLTSPSVGQFLVHNGSKWINSTINMVTTLAGLSDVTISSATLNQVLTFNGNKWTNITPTMPKIKYVKYKFMNVANAYVEGMNIPLGYAGYIVRCYNELPGQNYFIRLPATNSVPEGTMFYVQIIEARVNVSFYPYETDQQGQRYIILLGGEPWVLTTVSSALTYKFTFHSNLPGGYGAGYVLELSFVDKIPLDPACSVYLFDTTNWGPFPGHFLMPDPIVNGQTFRIVDVTGLMFYNQVVIWGTYNNKIDQGLDLAWCWTSSMSREYLYVGDGTNGVAVCINQCITTNPGVNQ